MIYTFRCPDCGCTWQKEMKPSKYKLPNICEICGWSITPQKRVYDTVNAIFKGTDFTKSVKEEQ